MPVKDIVQNADGLMKKSVDHLTEQYTKVRTGRASASLLDNVKVEYYGENTPIAQVGGISVPDARTMIIQPWDAGSLPAIEKAILAANLGLTPQNDGQVIRISIPPLTEERRLEIVKQAITIHQGGNSLRRGYRWPSIVVPFIGQGQMDTQIDIQISARESSDLADPWTGSHNASGVYRAVLDSTDGGGVLGMT